MEPLQIPNWIFDLDGTLTKPIFDFPKIKKRLGLPTDRGILEVMQEMEPEQAEAVAIELEDIEYEMAGKAEAAPGALDLLQHLSESHKTLGILTRNKKSHALHTLAVTGMAAHFEEAYIVGRDEAAHKPSPEGINLLLKAWQVTPHEAVMVGDFLFDLQAAAAAGARRIYVDPTGAFPYKADADISVTSLAHLLSTRTAQQ